MTASEHKPARIAILGAGGIGAYYGGLLARSGQDVTFIARGGHLAALQTHGLVVQSVHGDFELRPVHATDDPGKAGPMDLVLVTVKNYDLEAAAGAASPLIDDDTVALPLLNGIDAAERLAAVWGPEHVLAGLTHISSRIAEPGVIEQTSAVQRITLGESDGTTSARARHIAAILAAAGIDAVLSTAVNVALWEKFLFIASISGVCCIARQPMGPVLRTPETCQLYVKAMEEVEAIAHARGVALPDRVVANALTLSEGFSPATRPSLLVDLEAGHQMELEAMSGTIVRYGVQAGIPTPIHSVIYAALKPSAVPGQ